MATVYHVFSRLRLIKIFWKNYHSNIWMLPKFFNWIHLIPISGELIKNLLVRTATENFEFSESDPQVFKIVLKMLNTFKWPKILTCYMFICIWYNGKGLNVKTLSHIFWKSENEGLFQKLFKLYSKLMWLIWIFKFK